MVDVSINELSIKNLWSNDPSTVYDFVKYVPWYTTILLNDPVLDIILPFASVACVVVVVIVADCFVFYILYKLLF